MSRLQSGDRTVAETIVAATDTLAPDLIILGNQRHPSVDRCANFSRTLSLTFGLQGTARSGLRPKRIDSERQELHRSCGVQEIPRHAIVSSFTLHCTLSIAFCAIHNDLSLKSLQQTCSIFNCTSVGKG